MTIRLQRLQSYDDYTLGAFYINGKLCCFTMEDEKRNVKVWGETRIPAGVYKLRLQTAGKMSPRYAAKFSFHKGMLHLMNVPNFEGVFIHIGNTDDDTAGCILLGLSHSVGSNLIGSSTKAYSEAYPLIADAIASGAHVTISVVDELIG